MLKRIRLIDFKSFIDEEVELAPLTLLVGANGSGKSNFLDALWFLHGLSQGLALDEVLDGEERRQRNGEPWPGLRGGSKEASRFGCSKFEIRTVWGGLWGNPEADPEVRHEIVCRTLPSAAGFRPRVIRESCGTTALLELVSESPFSGLSHLSSESGGPALVLATRGFGLIHQISIRPEQMRDYGHLKRPQLASDGSNFSGALHQLCSQTEERAIVVDWLTELLAPEIVDIDFIEVEELGDVMAMFVEKDGTRVSARSLSDGTLRFLGLLLLLRQASRGSTLLIEEIDSELHPSRIGVLMDFLTQITRERELQIIATTHDPTCLEFLDRQSLHGAIVFGRIDEKRGAILRRFGDLAHFDEALRRNTISELFINGWLEMAL